MFQARPNEPDYALLHDPVSQSHNRYGQSIETVPDGDARRGASLSINQDAGIGANPNRYKQHGFYFNADNCIACHACEVGLFGKERHPGAPRLPLGGLCRGRYLPKLANASTSRWPATIATTRSA